MQKFSLLLYSSLSIPSVCMLLMCEWHAFLPFHVLIPLSVNHLTLVTKKKKNCGSFIYKQFWFTLETNILPVFLSLYDLRFIAIIFIPLPHGIENYKRKKPQNVASESLYTKGSRNVRQLRPGHWEGGGIVFPPGCYHRHHHSPFPCCSSSLDGPCNMRPDGATLDLLYVPGVVKGAGLHLGIV